MYDTLPETATGLRPLLTPREKSVSVSAPILIEFVFVVVVAVCEQLKSLVV